MTRSIMLKAFGLSSDEENTLRSSVGRDTACRRWLVQKPRQGVAGLYFMPHEFRNGFQQKPQKEEGVQTRETHPLIKEEEMLEVGEEGSSPLLPELLTTLPMRIQPPTSTGEGASSTPAEVASVLEVETAGLDCNRGEPPTKTPEPFRGVSLSPTSQRSHRCILENR